MSEKNTNMKKSSRLDKFLFYAKFVVLIMVALLFVVAYSFSYREFPTSSARYEYSEETPNNQTSDEDIDSVINILVVMDYSTEKNSECYSSFYILQDLINGIDHANYDLILIPPNENGDSSTVLNNMNDGLLLRAYQSKNYKYIISIGDNALYPSMEIKELFFPKSQILLYCTSGSAENSLISDASVSQTVLNTILTATEITPDTQKLVFLCNKDDYCEVITNIAKNLHGDFDDLPYEILYPDEYTTNEAAEYINQSEETLSIFYVSFINEFFADTLSHSYVINELHSKVDLPIFDLSLSNENEDIKSSLRYYPFETTDEPLAHLGLLPKDAVVFGYETVEFAAVNMTLPDEDCSNESQYTDLSAFINRCMMHIGFNSFPDTLTEQIDFCYANDLLIQKDGLRPGDIIFTSTRNSGSIEDINGAMIYAAPNIVISINDKGIICFTEIDESINQIAYAHPYSYLYDD